MPAALKRYQFTIRRLLEIVFAVSAYCAAWRILDGDQRVIFLLFVAFSLAWIGTLYGLHRRFPPPPSAPNPGNRVRLSEPDGTDRLDTS
jgi:hypothetical protein